jgi:DNA polymerase
MKILTIDFETLYTKDYSLTKLTTEEYIRDEQFEVIGVSVQVDDGEPQWFSGTHAQIKEFLSGYKFEEHLALAHNSMFDAAILGWVFGINPHGWLDTLSMARALYGTEVGGSLKTLAEYYDIGVKGNEVVAAQGKRRIDFTDTELARYGEYCKNDTALTYKLFQCMADGFPKIELRLIDLTIKMFSEPVLRLDHDLLTEHLTNVRASKDTLMEVLERSGYTREDLMSNPKLAEILTKVGVEPPTKISPTTDKKTWAFSKTDEEFKALLEHPLTIVQNIVAARLGVKSTLEETRTERFIDIAQRGPMPVPLRYYAAHTGRWGGCLVADTEVLVVSLQNGVETKRIVDVLLDDLVWDGEAFVPHEGVVFSGFSEVIAWDGVVGTEDHVVFTDAGEISLREAMQGQHRITVAGSPSQNNVDSARQFARNSK